MLWLTSATMVRASAGAAIQDHMPVTPPISIRMKRPGDRRSASRTATRALDLMELFGSRRVPLRAVEICRVLEVTPSSANQLLKTMVDSGHLTFDARSKEYRPSPRLAAFGGWIVELYGSEGRLLELVKRIEATLGMVATLSTPNDIYMQILDSAIPEGRSAERGLRISIFGSAIGSAYLATLDDADVARLADRARIPDSSVAAILAELSHVRSVGFAQAGSVDEQAWSIAIPLPARDHQVPTVLGLAGPPDAVRGRLAEIVAVMQAEIDRL